MDFLRDYKPSIKVKLTVIGTMALSFIVAIICMIFFDILRDQYVMINCIIDLLIMAILIMLVMSCINDENIFINYMIALYATVFTGALGSSLIGFPVASKAILIFFTLSYMLTGVSFTLFGMTISSLIPGQKPSKIFNTASVVLGSIYILIAAFNIETGFFFSVGANGRIDYNNYDAPRTFCLLVMLVYFIAYIIRANCDIEIKRSLLASAIFPMIACIANIVWVMVDLNYEIESFTNLSFIFSALMIFVNVYQRNTARMVEQEADLTNARVDLLVSQIHPHFVSNTLGMIRSMYREDASSAEKAMNTFISYLQKNFSDITNNVPVSAEKEIAHAKEFIELELMRWPDMAVQYDIKTTDFVMPSMTIQPLVENAINHGLMPLSEGGLIKISTDENDREYILMVEDNGVGFDEETPINNKARKHIGIGNVAERIEKMCSGSLQIESEKMKGTRITVRIPKGEA